jgi:hypothetical protein
MGGSVGAEG